VDIWTSESHLLTYEQPVTVIDLQDDDTSTDEDESFDTSNGTDLDHIELPTNTQDANGSFSSLIDYNPDNASDRSDPATISPPSVRSTTIPVTSVSYTCTTDPSNNCA
jgi:hypothetical protein